MRVIYLFQLKKPVLIQDYWPIPILDGEFRMVTNSQGFVSAFRVSFSGKPVSLSPEIENQPAGEEVRASIKIRDELLPKVQAALRRALVFLRGFFDVEVRLEEPEAQYEGETPEEEALIQVKSFSTSLDPPPPIVPFDLLSRAVFASEGDEEAPEVEVSLFDLARSAMAEERFIDSFRYSFLLFESVFGQGKFKSAQLKAALRSDADFKRIVALALKQWRLRPQVPPSDTARLLSSTPPIETLIDHLVDQRGFYFHGNTKHKNPWRPHQQKIAEALCLFCLDLAMRISTEAAKPMFSDELANKHFNEADRVGAIVVMNVKFRFREPLETFDRDHSISIRVPGTKVTPRLAAYVAQHALEQFQHIAPVADLMSASCVVDGTNQKVFDLSIHVAPEESAGA